MDLDDKHFYTFPYANSVYLCVCVRVCYFRTGWLVSRCPEDYNLIQSVELDVMKLVGGDFKYICSSETESHRSLAHP